MTTIIYALGSVIIVSLISFIGVFTLSLNQEKFNKLTSLLVALSIGTLLGDAFLHLIPEIMKGNDGSLFVWLWIIGGILSFFILEKIVCWHHCHIPASDEHHHPMGTMNLVGDGLHNFIDGVIIAGSFLVSVPLGLATVVAIVAHEIPSEISRFGILIYSGFSRKKALLYNFFSATTAILGTALTLFVGSQINGLIIYIAAFTAGGFIYIASADLIPELHKETAPLKSLKQILIILIGVAIMWAMKILLA